jgi:hypothetical protein
MHDEEFVPIIEGSLKLLLPPKDEGIQNSSVRTFGAILSRVQNPMDEHSEYIHKFLYHARYALFYYILTVVERLISYAHKWHGVTCCIG